MDKLEKHIKSKLKERQIRPSDVAWNKIEAELGDAPKSNNKGYYYGIAASFIGVLIVSSIYFLGGSVEDQQPKVEVVVSEPRLKEKESLDSDNVTKDVFEKPAVFQSNTTLADTRTVMGKVSPMVDLMDKVVEEDILTDNTPEKKAMAQVALNDNDKIIEAKLNKVLAQVTNLEAQNVLVTDAEVDSLLRVAQREILTDQLLQDNGKVDAMVLLNEVEEELDQSFRDQIFEKLKDGFFKVRTAVADRNN
ncbi:hypothetical protein [uncultured Croceitalea sp.]|uniref:hypothetical protein n=1 Tax=uncultured Croceitalea sp. TaxID=1798908 RepID=UPI00330611F8